MILFESNAAFAGIRDLLVRHARFGPEDQGGDADAGQGAPGARAFSVPVENGCFRLKGERPAASTRASRRCSTR